MNVRNPKSGLSQLEALIALAVMGLISVVLANAFSVTGQLLNRSFPRAEETSQFLARDTLRKWVSDMPLRHSGWINSAPVSGDGQELQLFTLVSDGLIWASEPAVISVRVQQGSLIAIARGVDREGQPATTKLLIDTEVSGFALNYLGSHPVDQPPRWHDSWKESHTTPELIKLEWVGGLGEVMPPLLLQPGLTEQSGRIGLAEVLPRE